MAIGDSSSASTSYHLLEDDPGSDSGSESDVDSDVQLPESKGSAGGLPYATLSMIAHGGRSMSEAIHFLSDARLAIRRYRVGTWELAMSSVMVKEQTTKKEQNRWRISQNCHYFYQELNYKQVSALWCDHRRSGSFHVKNISYETFPWCSIVVLLIVCQVV